MVVLIDFHVLDHALVALKVVVTVDIHGDNFFEYFSGF